MKEKVREIIKILREESSIFHLFDDSDLEKVAPLFEEAHFPAGAQVFKEEDPPDFLAVISRGRIEIKKETEFKGKQIVLAQMTTGAVLGELSICDDHPRSATVEAIEDTDLLILRNETLESFIESHPAQGIKLLKGLSRVLSMRLRQLADRLVMIF